MKETFINPFTDFGFKKLFGEEANKDLLIDFLNEVLQQPDKIKSLNFLKNEQLGDTPMDRKAIFDLYCESESGEKFIVELQKAKQQYFKERSLYYATFAIQEQAIVGDWNFKLNKVFSISIMDFVFEETGKNNFRHDVQLIEISTQKVFNDKLRFVYLEMPKFNKGEDELETHFDKWMYLLKNLSQLQKVSPKLQERIFMKVFEVAKIAKYKPEERQKYQESLKYYRDWKNALDTAIEEGRLEGKSEGKLEEKITIAKNLKNKGLDLQLISETTGLSREEIQKL